MARSREANVERVLSALLDSKKNRQTRSNYRGILESYFAWCDEMRVYPLLPQRADLEQYTSRLATLMSRNSIGSHQTALGAFFRTAVELGVIPKSPMEGFTRVRPVTDRAVPVLGMNKVRLLRSAAHTLGAREGAVIDMLLMNGLEPSEIANTDVEHLRNDGRRYWLDVQGRGQKVRTVAIAPPVIPPLLEHLGSRRRGPLILGQQGERCARTVMTEMVTRAAKKAAIGNVSPRDLRAVFISTALSRGLPLDAIRECIGVSDIRRLTRYQSLRGSTEDVPSRVAEAILVDPESGLLVQARRLLDDPHPVHVAAPVVLIGAALEEHLRALVARESLTFVGEGSINAYAGALRKAGLLSKQDVKGIALWADLRNDAAHGDLSRLTRPSAESMLQGVSQLIQQLQ